MNKYTALVGRCTNTTTRMRGAQNIKKEKATTGNRVQDIYFVCALSLLKYHYLFLHCFAF